MHHLLSRREIEQWFSRAKRPLLVVGQGVRLGKAVDEFRFVVDRFQIPVLTARLGMDLIEYDHPSFVGHPGHFGTKAAWFALDETDLVLVVGCRLSSETVNYGLKAWAKNAKIVIVDLDKKELMKYGRQAHIKIHQDAKIFLRRLSSCTISVSDEWKRHCRNLKLIHPMITASMKKERPVNSYVFVERLSELARPRDIVVVDTGSCFHVAAQVWKIKRDQRYLTTGGISSMGWWVAALGTAPLGHTILITGDGSLQMNLQELATVKHYNLPIKMFVLNNDGYGLIRASQRRFFGDQMIGEGPKTGVWCPDLRRVANLGYGLPFRRVRSIKTMDRTIKEVLTYNNGPVVCEVMIPVWQKLIRQDEDFSSPIVGD